MMKQKHLLILGIIALIISIILINEYVQEKQIKKEIKFETVSESETGGSAERKDYLINSQEEWTELRKERTSGMLDGTPLTEVAPVDFLNSTIIAVYQGSCATGGYWIEITRIVEKDDQVIVYVKETKSSGITTQAVTEPYHIVKTQKITKEVIFDHF